MGLINKCQMPRLAWFSIPNHKKKKKIHMFRIARPSLQILFFFFAKKVNIYCTSLISFFKKPMIARLVA